MRTTPCMAPCPVHVSSQGSPPVDLVVRTSGETRLSDFLLLQSASAQLAFVDLLWPDLSFVDFARWVGGWFSWGMRKIGCCLCLCLLHRQWCLNSVTP